jgi:DNA mismatch repair protein MutS2
MTFSSDFEVVKSGLSTTSEMVTILDSGETFPLGTFQDVSSQLGIIKVPGTMMPAQDLMIVRRSLETVNELVAFFASKRQEDESSIYPYLDDRAALLQAFPEIIRLIDRVIDRFGEVKDSASAELADIRSKLNSTAGTINSMMRRVLSRAVEAGYIEPDTKPSIRDGRLVIPVAPMNKRRISGIVHDESASGKTIFIEPAEIVEANNRVRELQMEERREIIRILTLLADDIRPEIDNILASLDIVGEFDFIHAKAQFARQIEAHMPALEAKPEIEWYHATHPILLLSLRRQGKEIVPLDITLTIDNRLLIISGPNAGGKSVCLKTVGIVQYMTQCGMLPPVYENSHMGIFEDIFVDIGDDQSMEDDLSTYSSHLRNMKYFLQHGRATTLVLIDEFGGGTEPQIGGAIAQSVLKQFNELGMWGVITTHYQNLKHFADETAGLINGSMLYDRHLMQPTFRLSIGHPGSSFAVEIARKIGLPDYIISEAEAIVGSDYINMDKYLLDIARDRRYWENKRLSIRQKEKKLDAQLTRYEDEAEQLRSKRREILNDAKEEARKILEGSNATIERTIHEIKLAQAEKDRTREARQKLQEEKSSLLSDKESAHSEHPLLKKAPKAKKQNNKPKQPQASRPIVVGDNVKLEGQDTVGTVISVDGKNATVAFGVLKTTVKLDRLVLTVAKAQSGAKSPALVSGALSNEQRQKQLNFKQEIDLRGMRVDEAVQALTYYIDDAIRFNASTVRILHGTGTGALRQYLRQYLDTVPGVKRYHDEHVQFGGAGITVVELS